MDKSKEKSDELVQEIRDISFKIEVYDDEYRHLEQMNKMIEESEDYTRRRLERLMHISDPEIRDMLLENRRLIEETSEQNSNRFWEMKQQYMSKVDQLQMKKESLKRERQNS